MWLKIFPCHFDHFLQVLSVEIAELHCTRFEELNISVCWITRLLFPFSAGIAWKRTLKWSIVISQKFWYPYLPNSCASLISELSLRWKHCFLLVLSVIIKTGVNLDHRLSSNRAFCQIQFFVVFRLSVNLLWKCLWPSPHLKTRRKKGETNITEWWEGRIQLSYQLFC